MKRYSLGEEIANSITHGLGAGLSIAGLVLMIVFAAFNGNVWQVVSVSIYGGTLVLLYTMSTLYHAITNERAKKVLRIFDHASIYLLIAGTYTPFTLVVLRTDSFVGWTLFCIIWAMAICGIIVGSIHIGKHNILMTLFYIIMGWAMVLAMPDLIKIMKANNAMAGVYWLIAGGLSYTLGTVFYIIKKKYFHSIWHVFVLLGSLCHFITVLFYVI